jgi:hypothetical protein
MGISFSTREEHLQVSDCFSVGQPLPAPIELYGIPAEVSPRFRIHSMEIGPVSSLSTFQFVPTWTPMPGGPAGALGRLDGIWATYPPFFAPPQAPESCYDG